MPLKRQTRTTRPIVRWVDRATTIGITAGGIGVIFAVLGIFAYLVWVTRPLFSGATVRNRSSHALVAPGQVSDLLLIAVDEYRIMGTGLFRNGTAIVFSLHDGAVISSSRLFEVEATAISRDSRTGDVAVGFADGTVRLGRIAFDATFPGKGEIAPDLASFRPGEPRALGGDLFERTPTGEVRRTRAALTLSPPKPAASSGDAITLLDYRVGGSDRRLAVRSRSGEILIENVLSRENMLTGETETDLTSRPLPRMAGLPSEEPFALLTTSKGDQLYLGWKDGRVARFDLLDLERPALVEVVDLVQEPGAELTALTFVHGEQSLVTGDSLGRTRVFFRIPSSEMPDGFHMVQAHDLDRSAGAIRCVDSATRGKVIATGDATGTVRLHHPTSEQLLGRISFSPPSPVAFAVITPKGDGLFALAADGRAAMWDVEAPHPETTMRSLFGRVWYEGYSKPEFTWQSSSGTDDSEPKLGLVPLVFGTIKATIYSLLFAVPIALLAAIYTSEFLPDRLRIPIKSTIELMASLPSVVLGFLGALVLAPVVERSVLSILVAAVLIPVVALGSGYAWQLLPSRLSVPLGRRYQLLILITLLVALCVASLPLGAVLERVLFGGDFKGWLDGRGGSGGPGLVLLLWPFLFFALLAVDQKFVIGPVSERGTHMALRARREVVKFVGIIIVSIGAALLLGFALGSFGVDPRGSIVGTYVQRNALIAGFVMGFAVIPIIYTVAEDALSSVPRSLRSASLGCGATRWQTAIRIVLPVATPGIFSALMIGLGRAVGETMIVLMVAGNTPILDMNPFNGLRTLSATIAVEMPEAVKDGSLYRTLFLAALTLFVLTFIVNTAAEIVRQRFRKRTLQL